MRRFLTGIALLLPALAAEPAGKPAAAIVGRIAEVPEARHMTVRPEDTVVLRTKVRNVTWVVFPADELIRDVGTGDAGTGDDPNWRMGPVRMCRDCTNIFQVKPSVEGLESNFQVATSAGRIYSFKTVEISKTCGTCQPDYKIFVDPVIEEPPMKPEDKFGELMRYQEVQIAALTKRAEASERAAKSAQVAAKKQIDREVSDFIAKYPVSLRCDYQIDGWFAGFNKGPFYVRAICSDGRFTYIKSGGEGVASVYADPVGRKPSLVQSRYERGGSGHDGTYIVSGIITRGEMRMGKKRLRFQTRPREEN